MLCLDVTRSASSPASSIRRSRRPVSNGGLPCLEVSSTGLPSEYAKLMTFLSSVRSTREGPVEVGDLLRAQRRRRPIAEDEVELGRLLQLLVGVDGLLEACPRDDRAVVGEQHRPVLAGDRLDRIRERAISRPEVRHQRELADPHHVVGRQWRDDVLRLLVAEARDRHRIGGVQVDDGSCGRPLLEDREVEEVLLGRLVSADVLSSGGHLGDAVNVEISETRVRRRHQDGAVLELHRQVPGAPVGELPRVEQLPHPHELAAELGFLTHDLPLPPARASSASSKKSSPPKFPDFSARATPRSSLTSTGTPGLTSGPIVRPSRSSACATAPDVSPPATTTRLTPRSTSRLAVSANSPSNRADTVSRPCRAWAAATSSGAADEKTSGALPWLASMKATRSLEEVRPSITSSTATAIAGWLRRWASTWLLVMPEQLPASTASGPSTPSKRLRPPLASPLAMKFAGSPSAIPDPPVTSGASAHARPILTRSSSVTASTIASVSPRSAQARTAAWIASVPSPTTRAKTWPTSERVCRRSQRRMSASVIGVNGWCCIPDSLSRRSPTKRCPWKTVRPIAGKAGQATTPLTPSASARASATGPMLPSGVESKVEQYLNTTCRHPCAFSQCNASSEAATASSTGTDRDFSDTTPASTSGAAVPRGTPMYCEVTSPPCPGKPLARVLAMSPAPVKSSAITPISTGHRPPGSSCA